MFDGACRRLFAICHRPSKVECLMLLCRSFFFYIYFLYLYIYFHSLPLFRCYLFICAEVFCWAVSPNYRRRQTQKARRTAIVFYMPRSVFALHRDSAEQLNRPTIVVGVLEHSPSPVRLF
jgi:hypothetical protein